MDYIKIIVEGFIEVIGLIPTSLILQLLPSIQNASIKNQLVTISPLPIIVVFIVYIFIAIFIIRDNFKESISAPRVMSIKLFGWIIAIMVIISVFKNPLFDNLEVIPETMVWLVVVGIGNTIAYYKNKRESNGR
ncbi:MAG: hypothetical protein QW232_10275 [Saccharolobus sp.]